MEKALYITATEERSGKSVITLSLMSLLIRRVGKVGFFRPIINTDIHLDNDFNLINKYFDLGMIPSEAYACTFVEARKLINSGKMNELIEKILDAYKHLQEKYDFILCQGSDFIGKDTLFELDLNVEIASSLGAPAILVFGCLGKTPMEVQVTVQSVLELFNENGVDILSTILNRNQFTEEEEEDLKAALVAALPESMQGQQVYCIPENDELGEASMRDLVESLGAEVLFGEKYLLNHHVNDYLIAAMHLGNFLNYVQDGHLIITPGDRDDILLGSVIASMSRSYPDIAGVLLTGGIKPSSSVMRILQGMRDMTIPILSVSTLTYDTVQAVAALRDNIKPDDTRKLHMALGHFEKYVNIDALPKSIEEYSSTRITPRMFEYQIFEQARKYPMRVVLPEGEEKRILLAAEVLQARGVAEIILLGQADQIAERAYKLNVKMDGITIIQPDSSPHYEDYVNTYFELRKHKNITKEEARDRMVDPTYFGTMMVYKDHADALVSGAANTTANTVRPALEFIKTKEGVSIVSSVFFICLKDQILVFGDCAINPDPTAEQLADIAISAATTAKTFGIDPCIAMLSYSTGGSGSGKDVDKVREATKIAKEKAPHLLLDGPLQYDAAIDPEVARTKMPGNPVAGNANVFIFPDLNTGNNTYKAVQKTANAIAIGPVLQGLRKPVNDLSRGCSVADIVNTVAITAIQAQAEKGLL